MNTESNETHDEPTTTQIQFTGEPSLNDYYADKNLARDVLISIPVGAVAGALTALVIAIPLLPPVMNPQRIAVITFLFATGLGIATTAGMTVVSTTVAAIVLRYYGVDPRPRCWKTLQAHRIDIDDGTTAGTGGEDR